MSELRITWNDLLRAGACVDALPAFEKAVAEQGHGEPGVVIISDGWKKEHVDKCLGLPGGAMWLHFLERKEIVPIVESEKKRFPRALAGHRTALIARMAKRVEEAKRAIGR